jgi:hypothetical protein
MQGLLSGTIAAARAFTVAVALLPLAAQDLRLVRAAEPGQMSWTMDPRQRALAVTTDGALWTLIIEHVPAAKTDKERLYLMRSGDGGMTWQRAADTATTGDGEGSLVASPDGLLHLLWHAREDLSYFSVYHQVFHVKTLAWLGQPRCVAPGTSEENEFRAGDIDITASGAVVATVQTGQRPPRPWRGGWSTGLLIRKTGDANWGEVEQVNIGPTGGNSPLVVHDTEVHIAYSSAGAGGFGV